MSIRINEYIVSPDHISPDGIKSGGVQGEHNACKLIFRLNDSLSSMLISRMNEGRFSYRFDAVDAVGERFTGVPTEFSPNNNNEFSYYLENFLTSRAGIIEVYFIITLSNGTSTEMELVALSVKLSIKGVNGKVQEDLSGISAWGVMLNSLSEKAEQNSKAALEAAERSEECLKQTKAAAVAFGEDAEWVFGGGDAYSNVGVNFILENTVSEKSENPVSSRAIATFVKSQIEKRISESEDYITESNIYSSGSFEKLYVIKRKNGIAELYGITYPQKDIKFTNLYGGHYYTDVEFILPEAVFKEAPIWADIKPLSGNGLLLCSIKNLSNNKFSAYFANPVKLEDVVNFEPRFMIRAIGEWEVNEDE